MEKRISMLSSRQLKILLEFCAKPETIFVSRYFSDKLSVSVRTVKGDLEAVRGVLKEAGCAVMVSIPSKGRLLRILDEAGFLKFFEEAEQDYKSGLSLTEGQTRVKRIISRLLGSGRGITKERLMEELYVSESTLYLDMKQVKKIIEPYRLTLVFEAGKGYRLEGTEKCKRQCLVKEDIYTLPAGGRGRRSMEKRTVTQLEEIIVEALVEHEFKISDTLFRELIVYVVLSIERMLGGNFIKMKRKDEEGEDRDGREYVTAKSILSRCGARLHFPVKEDEIGLLAVYLKGRGDYDRKNGIPSEVNDFISASLVLIKKEFSVDFTGDVELNIFLCLHFIPLLARLKNDMQLENEMLGEIRQSFPFAFDIAIYFSLCIEKEYEKKICQGEISYFALCFAYGLENLASEENAKRILIITSLKRSETILIRQRLNQWFKNQIAGVDFISQAELSSMDIQDYDVVFTTMKTLLEPVKELAVPISIFPGEGDYKRMNMAINGYVGVESVLSKFYQDLAWRGSGKSKEAVLNHLLQMAEGKFGLPDTFRREILAREELGSTYFGNKIAIPHPLCPITKETFVAAALLENEICWGGKDKVRLVLMVSAEANNPKAFWLWHYLSSLVGDKELVRELLSDLTYDNLLKQLKVSLKDKF